MKMNVGEQGEIEEEKRVYCKGVSGDLRGQHCYHHYWNPAFPSTLPSFSLPTVSPRARLLPRAPLPARRFHVPPPEKGKGERERARERAINFPGTASCPYIFFIHRETDTQAARPAYTRGVAYNDTGKSVG